MKAPDSGMLAYCRNVLHTHANWVHGLPELGSRTVAGKIAEVAELLGDFEDMQQRTYTEDVEGGSQCDEDTIIASLFCDKPVGVYVDIGAGQPKICSNTWALYQRGWRGLLIEPLPQFMLSLIRYREGDHYCWTAASDHNGTTPIQVNGSVTSCLVGWSETPSNKVYMSGCRNIADILDSPDFRGIRDACDFCSLDVEGYEAKILAAMPWNLFTPKAFCVEYRKYHPSVLGEDISAQWEPILLEHGYTLHATTALNKIYVKA